MEEKNDLRDLVKLIFATLLGVAIIILAFYVNYKNIRDYIISKEQQQLLTISKSVSRSLEQYFDYHRENLQIITKNQSFKEQFKKYISSDGLNSQFNSLEDYYIIQEDNIDRIQLLNLDSHIIDQYPKNDLSIHPYILSDIQKVLKMKTSVVSKVYPYNGQFFIRLYEPVFYNSKIKAILCIQVKLDRIYEQFVKPIRTGKGYASVKDQHGILLMHPKKEDIGKNVIKARKEEFPDYDWSELEALVQKQMNGESGVGIYHSIWYHDKNKKRVKKFSAYSPARIGDQFWIVTVSMDYAEMTKFIRTQTYKTVTFVTIVILIFISCMLYIYKIKKDKRILEKEASLLKQVNELNIELEKDIEQRKCLEKELIRNKEKYERLFNSGSDCIFVLNLDNKNLPTEFLEVNKKACKSLGYDKSTFLNMSYLDISKDSSIEKFKHMVESLKKNQSMIFEDTLVTSSGETIPVEINAHLFKLENQLKLILISRDITNRKIQEEALKRSEERFRKIINQVASEISVGQREKDIDIYEASNKQSTFYSDIENKNRIALELEKINIKLEEMFKKEVDENKRKEALMIYQSRLAAMGEMIGNIAHQWRQPISGLGLMFSNIQDAYKYGELTEEYLEELVEKSNRLINRMSQTIDDFRYFFNPKSEEVVFSVKENVEATIDFLEEHLRLNGIMLNIDVIEDGMIYGHANQYSQVIFNIVQNAIDALIKNRLNRRKINIRIFAKGLYQVVEIQDNGKGIDEKIINDVFKPYFTTKSKGKGTGLGLHMSKVIIEKNFHGNINIANQNDGLCVSIIVPRIGVDEDGR
ncbi:ATP-binding protein [Paramaledivibacter caminithermalis]|uniref:histidine kinase n=1 Tax=Paramaledivibacter caminithermalis (strain DSM 15212 / CIP 107654 / DViRD3) TaxID=1121301 RepID=A0A1M6PCS4_PARC5|nr:ATP-binding protein [Paramaledivibacter caminithermalis]SHK05746.1 PAS domain S-box-containing protein [Paramaledivibacter caminithermalis DSM 15212]